MRTALKEWAVVDEALGLGEQVVLLRKGGIHEEGGRFEIEHDAFLLYPTYLHQAPELLKPRFRDGCTDERSDKDRVTIRHFARAVESAPVPPPTASVDRPSRLADRWDSLHVYSRKRYAYKPERPLWLLLVRVYRLAVPATIIETSEYAGCRSWLTLDEDVSVGGAVPALDDAAFNRRAEQFRRALES